MEHVSRTGNDDHLEFALHLSDHEFFVETVCACEDEEAGCPCCEEGGGEACEPAYRMESPDVTLKQKRL